MPAAGWYLRRLSRMGPAEVAARVRARAVVETWRRRGFPSAQGTGPLPPAVRGAGPAGLAAGVVAAVPEPAPAQLLAHAEALLTGRAQFLGVAREDLVAPDWFADPRTGRRAPAETFAFDVAYRDESRVGDIKQIWELSRHHHLTVLAAAWRLTRDERYADRVAEHLKSWWSANPPIRGPHWISGIELGIRLISWTWTRRLLSEWPRIGEVFDENPEAHAQLHAHQTWLAALPSVGSSANNHLVAEATGRFVAACAFDWFAESARWREQSAAALSAAVEANTFASGLNRELASDYHLLVLELGLVALAEADAAGHPVSDRLPGLLLRMSDALAATVDCTGRPPRQGDGDDGQALALDALEPTADRAGGLLRVAADVFGPADWWPHLPPATVHSACLGALIRPRADLGPRCPGRPVHFADAGLTILCAHDPDRAGEVWVRADGGPHGFGAIAAHAHADALSVEVRIDGVDVLADPGTYCYHGQPAWRAAFRSTAGHNTLELDGVDQSVSGGPFLWVRQARSRVLVAHQDPTGPGRWTGEHDGYLERLGARHNRTLVLDPATRTLVISDRVHTPRALPARLSFHLGPQVDVELTGPQARLSWRAGDLDRTATLTLPATLTWTAHRGEVEPPTGWYSPGFGRKQPAWVLIGRGTLPASPTGGAPIEPLVSVLEWQW
jgi:hypothetical protein